MLAVSKNKGNDKSIPLIRNYSDDELIFKDLCLKCQALQKEKIKKLRIRQELLILNEKNENVTKSLLNMKREFEVYKSDLNKTLFNLKLSAEKRKLLSQKQQDEFFKISLKLQEYCKMSPKQFEVEKLLSRNKHLQEEWESKAELLELTKKQYDGLMYFVMQTFQKKVCEFCDVVLRLNH